MQRVNFPEFEHNRSHLHEEKADRREGVQPASRRLRSLPDLYFESSDWKVLQSSGESCEGGKTRDQPAVQEKALL